MSFTQANKPRIGEIARCSRCRFTWVAVTCDCGNPECGAALATPRRAQIRDDIASRLVADRSSLFCPYCMTNDERGAVISRRHAERRGEACN